MGICYIVGAGELDATFTPLDSDLVIAADGGYDSLRSHSIRCDLLVGDLDSVSSTPNGVQTLRYKVEKDETDMHLAFAEGYARGYRDFRIYGGGGGRIDHTFANYSLLLYAKMRGADIKMVTRDFVTQVLYNGCESLKGECGAYLSIFAFGGVAEGVCIRGAKYELCDARLLPEFPLGVSNSFLDAPVFIEVKSGALLIMQGT